jgi:hypothetical protein
MQSIHRWIRLDPDDDCSTTIVKAPYFPASIQPTLSLISQSPLLLGLATSSPCVAAAISLSDLSLNLLYNHSRSRWILPTTFTHFLILRKLGTVPHRDTPWKSLQTEPASTVWLHRYPYLRFQPGAQSSQNSSFPVILVCSVIKFFLRSI